MANPRGYTFAQLESLWTQAGGDPNWAPLMAAVALAESGGAASENNFSDSNGGSYGIWQINGSHYGVSSSTPPDRGGPGVPASVQTTLDTPLANAQAAVNLFNAKPAGMSQGAWVASQWTDPMASFARAVGDTPPSAAAAAAAALSAGVAQASEVADATTSPPTTVPNQGTAGGTLPINASTLGAATPGLNIIPWSTGLSTLLTDVTSGAWWKRVGIGVLGAALIIGGLVLFVSTTGTGKKIEGDLSSAGLAAALA